MAPTLFMLPVGLAFGSFATVLAHRIPRGEAFVTGRSRCPSCHAQIAAYDNVPVLSWLWLRGHCRRCRARISPRYPLAELAMALTFAATAAVLGTGDLGELAAGLLFCGLLVVVTLTDFERRIIPNKILLPGAMAAVGLYAATNPEALPGHLLAGAIAGGVLFGVALAYPRGLGMGDAKLAAVMGLFLGSAVAPALLVGFAAGSLVGVAMLMRHGAGARKQAIPFGPFLALGGLVGLWAGPALVDWYLRTFIG